MKTTEIESANDFILRKISNAGDQMIFGFLPLTSEQEESVLDVVGRWIEENYADIEELLLVAPAAGGYALAVAPSRTLETGGRFWPALESDLGLAVPGNRRGEAAKRFRLVCRKLGLLHGTIDGTAWIHAAPFIYQSGILHYWTERLAAGLQAALRRMPAPDMEDESALRRFTDFLGSRIHGQPVLSGMLETEIGPLLVRRLITAYLKQDWSVLPPHLKAPIQSSFENAGRGLVLRSPFLAFNSAFRNLEVVLPGQSPRLTTPSTHWSLGNRRHSARAETRIPIEELQELNLEIRLCNLDEGFDDQSFSLDASFNEENPFRVFRAESGREQKTESVEDISLLCGKYFVAMAPDARTNDEDYVFEGVGFRGIEIEMRPGDDPLWLNLGGRSWLIRPSLQQGIYVDRSNACVAVLANGELLHYGAKLGLVAFFPVGNNEDTSFKLVVSCLEQNLKAESEISSEETSGMVYRFQEDLESPVFSALDDLPPGIHRIEVSLSSSIGHTDHHLWFWKGLDEISEAWGFKCSEFPRNVNINLCIGLVATSGGIGFQPNFHAPIVVLALAQPVCILELPRAGVQLMVSEPGSDWEDEPSPNVPLVVAPTDRRVLRFRSGGFQRWELFANDLMLAKLDPVHTRFVKSLTGLVSEAGGSGRIFARREDGTQVRLAAFTKPLTASAPKHELDHVSPADVWRFVVPTEELYELGVSITELSDDPSPASGKLTTIAWRDGEGYFTNELNLEEGTIVVTAVHRQLPKDGDGPTFHSFADAINAAEARLRDPASNDPIRVQVFVRIDALKDRVWAIDFHRRTDAGETWVPLDCVERHGYSTVRIFAWGQDLPPDDAGWWRRLKRAERSDHEGQNVRALAESLAGMTLEELDYGLNAIRGFLRWKYPSRVWVENAHRVQDFAVHLGRHRFGVWDESAAIWWRHGAIELSDYASATTAPITRQFLWGSQPACLRVPRHCLEVGQGQEFSSPIGRSLNLPAEIKAAGSLKHYSIGAAFEREELDRNAVFCFSNFNNVQCEREDEFIGFRLRHFLKGGVAGVAGLEERVEVLFESQPRFDVKTLLSPEHLIYSVRALNRRCRVLERASRDDSEHPLNKTAQTIERLSQRIETQAPSIAPQIGWDAPGSFLWTPPLLENNWAVKIAQLCWMVAAISRLAANEKLSPEQFGERMVKLFCPNNPSEGKVQNRLCLLMSQGPELLAFYIALFELLFPIKKP